MTRRIIFRAAARADLVEIGDYISESSPQRARALVSRLSRRCETLIAHPFVGRPREIFGAGVRSLVERPYIILSHLVGDDIQIIGFLHGARDLPSAARKRLNNEDE